MSELIGFWDVNLKAPFGVMPAMLEFTQTKHGVVGQVTMRGRSWPLQDVQVQNTAKGDRAKWRLVVDEPMSGEVAFDVVFSGDKMRGRARASMLIRVRLEGVRIAPANSDDRP